MVAKPLKVRVQSVVVVCTASEVSMDYKKVVEKKRQKYGKNIFHTWGKRGGNPVLIAQGEGRVIIKKAR